ncbi:MAG TPA: FtsX-like permease family protein, partial [Gemmatimonadales bacterium]|nr:FtsX-like permease family protein [Gemmatimonadales bacterium]
GASLKAGRFFTSQDVDGSPLVAIVDEELVKTYWPDTDPIGKRITFDNFTDSVVTWMTVVGVVGHTMHEGLDGDRRIQLYLPLAQAAQGFMAFAVRTTAEPMQAVGGVRAALAAVDPDVAIANIDQMDELVSTSTGPRRFSMVLLTIFSLLAAALAAIGLYGVMAFTVTQRSKEMGVRLALGATPGEVQRMVMQQGMRLAVVGVLFGIAAAIALTNLLKALDSQTSLSRADQLLFNVSPHDPLTFVGVPFMLLSVALLASWVPAHRATMVDPVEALREE